MLAKRSQTFLVVLGASIVLVLANYLKQSIPLESDTARLTTPVLVPSPTTARMAALGNPYAAADVYWLKTLQYFGDSRNKSFSFLQLTPLLELVLALDPDYCVVYVTAGLILTSSDRFDVASANRLLEKGLDRCPTNWNIPFILGFNKYYFGGDYLAGGRLVIAASQKPEAPDWLSSLGARLLASSEDLHTVEDMLTAMIENSQDEKMREQYNRRLLRVKTERLLRAIDHAAQQYQNQRGHRPQSIRELQESGLAPPVLNDPSGGQLSLDANGKAQTTAYNDRFVAHRPPSAPAVSQPTSQITESASQP